MDSCVLCRQNLYVVNLFIYSNDSQILSANILYLLFTDISTSENASDMLKFGLSLLRFGLDRGRS